MATPSCSAPVRGRFSSFTERNLNQMQATPISGTEEAIGPFFSPDGQWVGFWADTTLKKVSLYGGPVATIASVEGATQLASGASWGPANKIVFAGPDGLSQVPAAGGTPQIILKRKGR